MNVFLLDDLDDIYDDPNAVRDRMTTILRDSSMSQDDQKRKMDYVSKFGSSVRKLWSEMPQVS